MQGSNLAQYIYIYIYLFIYAFIILYYVYVYIYRYMYNSARIGSLIVAPIGPFKMQFFSPAAVPWYPKFRVTSPLPEASKRMGHLPSTP